MSQSENRPPSNDNTSAPLVTFLDHRETAVEPLRTPELSPASPAPESGRETGPISWRKFWAYKGTILGLFILIAAPGLGWVWTQYGPEYGAKGQVHIRPIIPHLVFKPEESGVMPYYEGYVNTQVAMIRSTKLIDRVLARPDVAQTEFYRLRIDQGKAPLGELLLRVLQVEHDPRSEIIDVSMMTSRPRDAMVIVNGVLDEYTKSVQEASDRGKDFLYRQLTAERRNLREEIEQRERTASRLRKQIGTGTPDKLISEKKIRLDEWTAQLDRIDQEIALGQWQIKQAAGDNSSLGVGGVYENDSEWRQLRETLRTLSRQLEAGSNVFGERHFRIVELRSQLRLAQTQLRQRETELAKVQLTAPERGSKWMDFGDNTTFGIVDPVRRVELLKYKRRLATGSLQKQLSEFEQTFDAAQQLMEENETIRAKKDLLGLVQNRLDQWEMERNVPGIVEVMSWAQIPTNPTRDKRNKLSAMVVLAGLLAGLGLAHVRIRTNSVIREAQDVSQIMDHPFLGQIPLLARGSDPRMMDSVILDEAVRMIRTALLRRLSGQRGAVSVTSAQGGAGKTTVGILLARSLAQCGKKVLLVDADLRQPAVAQRCGIDPKPGLVDCLIDKTPHSHLYVDPVQTRLSILAAGTEGDADSPELLANGSFAGCLRKWRREFDVVILDTPPVLPVADARIIAPAMDGTMLVVREGSCQREDLIEAMQSLETCGANVLGMVYIGSSKRPNRPYYYGARTSGALTVRRG